MAKHRHSEAINSPPSVAAMTTHAHSCLMGHQSAGVQTVTHMAITRAKRRLREASFSRLSVVDSTTPAACDLTGAPSVGAGMATGGRRRQRTSGLRLGVWI